TLFRSMPGFPALQADALAQLVAYVTSGETKEAAPAIPSRAAAPASPTLKYSFAGYHKWYDPDGFPAVAPPWGTLNAINLNSGEYAWKGPLGEYPELAAAG